MSQPTTSDHALNAEVAKWISRGYAVEATTPGQAVLARKSKIGLFWNVVLTIITGGLWLIVVLYRVINRKSKRVVLYVDANGAVRQR